MAEASVPLESDLLRTFVTVSDTGSFTRAAKVVGRTQSAVSLQVKRLEQLAGGALFERGSRGVAPTRLGLELLTNARRVVSLLNETDLAFRGSPLIGVVRIGLPEEYGHVALTHALGAFAARHSNVEVTAQYGRSEENRSRVNAGELDLAVIFDWQNMPGAEVLRHDPTVWVTSETHRVDQRSPLPIAVYTSSAWCSDYAIKSLNDRGISFRIAYSSDTNGGLKLAVLSGLAIAPLSRGNIPEGCRELTSVDGFGAIDESRLVLHRNPRAVSAAVAGMASAMLEAFRMDAR
jgi:DNA-binding transcriptional LysR family regulator